MNFTEHMRNGIFWDEVEIMDVEKFFDGFLMMDIKNVPV